MALVLCTGVHTTLVHTRKLILERADHTVITALDHSSLVDACRQHNFDVAVICQSGSPDLKREWLGLIRRHRPSAKVLEVYSRDIGTALDDADSWLEAPTSPDALVSSLSTLVEGEKPQSPAAGGEPPGMASRSAHLEELRKICARVVTAQGTEFQALLEELSKALEDGT